MSTNEQLIVADTSFVRSHDAPPDITVNIRGVFPFRCHRSVLSRSELYAFDLRNPEDHNLFVHEESCDLIVIAYLYTGKLHIKLAEPELPFATCVKLWMPAETFHNARELQEQVTSVLLSYDAKAVLHECSVEGFLALVYPEWKCRLIDELRKRLVSPWITEYVAAILGRFGQDHNMGFPFEAMARFLLDMLSWQSDGWDTTDQDVYQAITQIRARHCDDLDWSDSEEAGDGDEDEDMAVDQAMNEAEDEFKDEAKDAANDAETFLRIAEILAKRCRDNLHSVAITDRHRKARAEYVRVVGDEMGEDRMNEALQGFNNMDIRDG